MSFSITFNIDPFADAKDFVAAAQEVVLATQDGTKNIAATVLANQMANGTGVEFLQAAEQGALCAWGACQAIGKNALLVRVQISGHVNVGFEKNPAWTNDFIQIGVSVLDYYTPPDPIPFIEAAISEPLVNA